MSASYTDAVARCRAAERGCPSASPPSASSNPASPATLKQIADCHPDAVLVRSLAAVSYYHEHHPDSPMIGDYSLNIANELTARIFADAGLIRSFPPTT